MRVSDLVGEGHERAVRVLLPVRGARDQWHAWADIVPGALVDGDTSWEQISHAGGRPVRGLVRRDCRGARQCSRWGRERGVLLRPLDRLRGEQRPAARDRRCAGMGATSSREAVGGPKEVHPKEPTARYRPDPRAALLTCSRAPFAHMAVPADDPVPRPQLCRGMPDLPRLFVQRVHAGVGGFPSGG